MTRPADIGSWAAAIAARGIAVRWQGRRAFDSPCPICGGRDRFWARQEPGRVAFDCRQRTRHDAGDLLRLLWGADAPRDRDILRDPPTRPKRRPPPPPSGDADDAVRAARNLWDDAVPATTDSPAALYLAARGVWPDPQAVALPDTVRWIPRERWRERRYDLGLPDSAGALLWSFVDEDGALTAVQAEALTAAGERLPARWRRDRGQARGSWFAAPGDSTVLAVAEGLADALALSWWLGLDSVSPGGANRLPGMAARLARSERPIEIHVDGDNAGSRSAAALLTELHERGVQARIRWYPAGIDPAEALAQTTADPLVAGGAR